MARASARVKPCVVEIQGHYYSDDRRSDKEHHTRPPVAHFNQSSSLCTPTRIRASLVNNEGNMRAKPLNRTSSEYEDVYNQRKDLRPSKLKQYGRFSFQDDMRYSGAHGYNRPSQWIAQPTQMAIMNGHAGEAMDRRDERRIGIDNSGHTRSTITKGIHVGKTQDPNRVPKGKPKDKIENREDLELWIARQTSFPKKQHPKIAVSDNSGTSQSNSVQDFSRVQRPAPRSASPALSVQSNQSYASSHVSQHSARSGASEVSVKSILKKPKPGRVVMKEEPSSYTLCAMLSCILCFPLGIYALIKSRQVAEAVDENDYERALKSSRKVKNFCIGVLVAYLGILAVAGALLAIYFSTGKIF